MKQFLAVFLSVLFILLASIPAFSATASLLSPALKLIAHESVMIKSGVASGRIVFSPDDFTRAVGKQIESITVTALPPASDGVLLYNNAPITVNQKISFSGLKYISFEPGEKCTESSFRFKAGSDYSIECSLKYTDAYNLAPTVAEDDPAIPVWTQMDISTFGTLTASDPEGDILTFEIVDYPKRGMIELINKHTGDYRYTPFDSLIGNDSFSYAVYDQWGNYSQIKSVIIDVDKSAADMVIADLQGHWAHNAALVMVADEAMSVRSVGGELVFEPEKSISREDFLVTVMKVLGAGEIPPSSTVFADDSEISENASGYVARAHSLGVISGSIEGGLLYFNPKDNITRAEAAVILNGIIGAETPDIIPVFADINSVPAWAKGSVYALTSLGLLKGTGNGNFSANEIVSRGETAQMLLTVKKMYMN